jgi:enamine deaminase RidA (YjgF/YER057c/UK114 family)
MATTLMNPSRFPWYDHTRYSFSLGVAAGGRGFLSGQTASAYDPERRRMVVDGAMAEQARTAYAKIEAVLDGAGMSLADVDRVVEYVTPDGLERYDEAREARLRTFAGQTPSVNTVPVRALLRDGALIEIEATAGPAGDLVFLSSIHPIDEFGEIIGPGDLVAQTNAVYDRAEGMLAALGLGLDRVVKTTDYVTPAALPAYKETAAIRRDRLGPVFPASAGIIMPRLMHRHAMIQLDLVATRATPVRVDPGWQCYDRLTYSPAVRAGSLLFISGQGAIDHDTGRVLHRGDVAAQAEVIYGNVLAVIAEAGGSAGNLVQTIEYTTPAAQARYREVAGVRTRLLEQPYPASTGPICEALSRPEMLIEVDALAVLDQ